MRITALLTVPLLAALIALPTGAPAQTRISVSFGTRLGPEINLSAYSRPWRAASRSEPSAQPQPPA